MSVHALVAETIRRVDATDDGYAYTTGPAPTGRGWWVLADLLAQPGALEALLQDLLDGDADGHLDVAGSYLASWLSGPVAQLLTTAWRREGRVLHVGLDQLSVHRHDDGWVDAVSVGAARLTVAPGDPAAGVDGVAVVGSPDGRCALAVAGIRDVAAAVFDAVRDRAPYGRAGMWGSLADGVAGTTLLAEQGTTGGGDPGQAWDDVEVLLDELARQVPQLRARPRRQLLRWAGGTRHQSVRGTCCLYHKTCTDPDPSGEGYCSSCPHRPDESRVDIITRWLEGQPA